MDTLILDNFYKFLPTIFIYLPFDVSYLNVNKIWNFLYKKVLAENPILVKCRRITNNIPLDKLHTLKLYRNTVIDLSKIEINTIYLENCSKVNPATFLNNSKIEVINILRCSITEITFQYIDKSKITTLNIAELNITTLDFIVDMPNLISLDIYGCQKITDAQPLSMVYKLQKLNISKCILINNLNALQLHGLNLFNMQNDWSYENLKILQNITTLRDLNISGCTSFWNTSMFNTYLHTLNISTCPSIKNLAFLHNTTSLTSLNIYKCDQISDLSSLTSNLIKLYCEPKNLQYYINQLDDNYFINYTDNSINRI